MCITYITSNKIGRLSRVVSEGVSVHLKGGIFEDTRPTFVWQN